MTVLLLDSRWPTMIPLEACSRLAAPVAFSSEVPVSVRWHIDKILVEPETLPAEAHGVFVTTDPTDPEYVQRTKAGEAVITAASLSDDVLAARQVMSQARKVGQWEREQTHQSLLPYLEEESREFADAVREGAGEAEMCKELGDIFLQVLFHAEIAHSFTLDDVAASFVAKMRSRAPYLFDGTTEVVDVDEQNRLWALGKQQEARGRM